MSFLPTGLKEAAEKVQKGQEVTLTVRQFLAWFGHERRGWRVVHRIRRCLRLLELETKPDFEGHWIDGSITLQLRVPIEPTAEPIGDPEGPEVPRTELGEINAVGGARGDATYRIGKLDAANKTPVSISPDAALNEAITIMLRDDYSQLPIMTSERDVKGAITWRSISKRLALVGTCKAVRECMDPSVEIISREISLFRVIELIAKNDFVLVRDNDRKISGIITAFDLGYSFHELARPFLLFSEIENHLRGIIDGRFSAKELQEVRNPNDLDREIETVSDLTFGEYVRLLQNPVFWSKVGLAIDRVAFTKDLERLNGIRNDVMHFDPDGIAPDELIYLGKQARFMQELREIAIANR